MLWWRYSQNTKCPTGLVSEIKSVRSSWAKGVVRANSHALRKASERATLKLELDDPLVIGRVFTEQRRSESQFIGLLFESEFLNVFIQNRMHFFINYLFEFRVSRIDSG